MESCLVCKSDRIIDTCRYGQFLFKECSKCGLVFLQNSPKESAMNKFYHYENSAKLQKEIDKCNPLLGFFLKSDLLSKPAISWSNYVNRERARSLLKKFVRRGRLLDIGCGPGVFIKYMQESGWDVYGSEIGNNLISLAKEKVGGRRVYEGKLETITKKLKNKNLEYITLWHVFEHIYDIKSLLRSVNEIIYKRGWLIIEVPHSKSLNFNIFKSNWTLLMVPQHLHFWNENPLRLLLGKYGFDIKEVEYPVHFPFIFASSLIKKNKYMFILLPVVLPFSIIFSIFSSFINKGDIIRVYAQKSS